MNIIALSEKYHVRRLDTDDLNDIYCLSCKNPMFYQYHPPFVTKESILEDMRALPLEKSMDDKYYVGFFEKSELVAIMDLILDYPKKDTAFIGLFMLNAQYQGKGIGSRIMDEVIACLTGNKYKEIRLGVDKGNPQSYAFWTKNGFVPIEERKYVLMRRTLRDV